RRLGVDRLDLMIATHPQLDHDGGLGEIAESGRPPVTAFLDGGGATPDPRFARLRALLTDEGATSAPAEAGATWSCGDLRIDVLGPPHQAAGPPPSDPNTRAAVTLATVGGLRLLASGDAESPQLLPLPLPRVDVLKVPHHGSADTGLAAVLARTGPRVAVIEVGRENRFGHPTPQALAALDASGASVFRTDRDGTVVAIPVRDSSYDMQVARHAEGGG
ncbi:MAG: MBL fold metallo-hydrolase, partial [Thermoleophilia bacterium]|nr:MBL fold metallo-hydrolase [Thermoleophilia bacterium]